MAFNKWIHDLTTLTQLQVKLIRVYAMVQLNKLITQSTKPKHKTFTGSQFQEKERSSYHQFVQDRTRYLPSQDTNIGL